MDHGQNMVGRIVRRCAKHDKDDNDYRQTTTNSILLM